MDPRNQIQALHLWAQIKVYVRGLELFGKLDAQTIESLFGNLNEVIQVNDGLEDELKLLRDERGIHFLYLMFGDSDVGDINMLMT